MSATIAVEKIDGTHFKVNVLEPGGRSCHEVTLSPEDRTRFGTENIEGEELIRQSFVFLLERENKESILPRFDLSVIGRYFPEYEVEIRRRLARRK